MSPQVLTIVIIVSFLALLTTGLPVSFSLISLSLLYMLLLVGPKALFTGYSALFGVMTTSIYIAIPAFVFMAAMLESSGIAERLYDAMFKWSGAMRGGLAIGTVAICTLMAAMTGIAATGVITMGLLAYPEMMKRGYHKSIPLGCIPAGGALGPLIPPSVIMVIVSGFSGVSVGKLFMGGVLPGLLMSFLFMAYISIQCYLRPEMAPAIPREERATWKEKSISLRGVILPVLLVVLVLGSIYSGAATPSEAGGVGAFGTLVCAAIYRRLNWGAMKKACMMTLNTSAMVLWLIVGGSIFAALMSRTGVTHYITNTMASMTIGPMGIIGIMMFIAFVLGMLMDASAISVICLPIFVPVAVQLGFDPLWFSLIFTINVIIGFMTPPFAVNLFYMKGIVPPEVTMAEIYRASIPYCGLMVIVLLVGIFWPPLLTWLPSLMK